MIKITNLANKAEIYIWGNIIDDTDANWIKTGTNGEVIGYEFPSNIKAQLDALKGIPIDVHIASDGGSVSAGIAIYNMLDSHDAEVNVYIDNWAASIASVIAFAGKKIYMPENTFLMIHNPAAGAFGDALYLRTVAEWLDKLRNMIAETYAKHMKAQEGAIEAVKAAMDAETWLTAAEAAEMFDNVEVLEASDLKAVAQFKSAFKTAPKNLVVDDETKKYILEVLKGAFEHEEKGGIVKGY